MNFVRTDHYENIFDACFLPARTITKILTAVADAKKIYKDTSSWRHPYFCGPVIVAVDLSAL